MHPQTLSVRNRIVVENEIVVILTTFALKSDLEFLKGLIFSV